MVYTGNRFADDDRKIHDLAKEIPKVGKVFFIEDVKLQIISRSINKINKVKLSI